MSAQDWLLILGGIGSLVVIISGQVILIIQAINKRADEAMTARREIAQTATITGAQQQPVVVVNPQTETEK